MKYAKLAFIFGFLIVVSSGLHAMDANSYSNSDSYIDADCDRLEQYFESQWDDPRISILFQKIEDFKRSRNLLDKTEQFVVDRYIDFSLRSKALSLIDLRILFDWTDYNLKTDYKFLLYTAIWVHADEEIIKMLLSNVVNYSVDKALEKLFIKRGAVRGRSGRFVRLPKVDEDYMIRVLNLFINRKNYGKILQCSLSYSRYCGLSKITSYCSIDSGRKRRRVNRASAARNINRKLAWSSHRDGGLLVPRMTGYSHKCGYSENRCNRVRNPIAGRSRRRCQVKSW